MIRWRFETFSIFPSSSKQASSAASRSRLQLTKLVDEEDDDKEDGNTIEGEEEIKVKRTIISIEMHR